MRQRWAVAVYTGLAVGVLAPGSAWAYRPFITEDAGVAGRGVAQVEAGYDHAHWLNGDMENVFVLAPTYGLTSRADLSLEVPFVFLQPNDGVDAAGPGDVLVGTKVLLLEGEPFLPAIGLRGSVRMPSGSERRGLGDGTWDVTTALAATKTVGPVALHAMLGYTVVIDGPHHRQNFHAFGVALDWRVGRRFHLVGEVAGNGQPELRAGPDPISGMLGTIYDVTEKLAIDFGVRRGFNRSVPEWTFTTGFTVTF